MDVGTDVKVDVVLHHPNIFIKRIGLTCLELVLHFWNLLLNDD